MGEEIILQDDKGKKYIVLRVLDADTKKIVDDLSELNINLKSDLYEANNRINDLLDIIKQKDKEIDEIILYIIRHNYFDTTEFDKNIVPTIENIRRHFEKRCK